MKPRLNGIILIINLFYPFTVLFGLRYIENPVKFFPVLLSVIILLNALVNIPALKKRDFRVFWRTAGMIAAGALVVVLIIVTDNAGYAKLYPVIINIALLSFFGYSLARPPTIIWRFATMKEPQLAESENRIHAERYCRNVTITWCIFFLANASVSLSMLFWASDMVWTIYNGFVSYILIGVLFGIEFIIRRRKRIGA